MRTEAFDRLFGRLPLPIQRQAVVAYRRWRENPNHPGLRFKRVGVADPLYSARVNDDYRAVAYLKEGVAVWFWIGPHDEYDRLLDG